MKHSLLILLFFIVGGLLGYFNIIPQYYLEKDYSIYVLYGLMFCVGLNIGYDKKILATLRRIKLKVILIPLATLLGTLAGTAAVSFLIPERSIFDCMAVSSGLGYYSLSSIFITQYKGAELGTIALTSNIIRELFAILTAPLLVLWFGKISPITAAGVASIDTVLPTIARYSGSEFIVVALFHGITLELCIPFLITFFCYI